MNIRAKLTLQFATIVAILMLLSFIATYFISAAYRKHDLYDRLERKANMTTKLLVDVNEISSDLLLKIERDYPTSLPYEKIRVYNYNDKLIFSTDLDNTLTVDKTLLDNIRLNKKIAYSQNNFEVLGFLFTSKLDRFVVIAAAKDVQGFSRLANLGAVLIIVFGVNIVLISLAGWFFSGRALKPISKVVSQVDSITANRLDLRLDEGNGTDEIAQLTKTFNNMLNRIESAFKVQKNFIANASHELRTPLTAISGQLEVKLLKPHTEEEYKKTIESVLEDMRGLSLISNQLLLLAQTSAENFQNDFIHVRMDEILWEARTDLIKLHANYAINISIDEHIEDGAQLMVRGNEYLLKTVAINLMDNACKYSPDNKVEVELQNNGSTITVRFIDKGIGIGEKDLPHIFESFYRGQNSSSVKGNGIGLSLVHRIVYMLNGYIEVKSVLNKGSVFNLVFPVAGKV